MAAVALLSPAAAAAVVTEGEEKPPLEEVEVVVRAIVADGDGREANAAAPGANGCGEEEVPAHAAEGGTVAAMVDENAAAPAAEGDMVVAAKGAAHAAAEGDTVAAPAVAGENEAAHAPAAGGNTVAAAADVKGEALQAIPVADEAAAVAEGVNAIAAAEREEDDEGVKWLKHYSSLQSILTVGDGDFSFSLALATAFGSGDNLVATSLDTIGSTLSVFPLCFSSIMVQILWAQLAFW